MNSNITKKSNLNENLNIQSTSNKKDLSNQNLDKNIQELIVDDDNISIIDKLIWSKIISVSGEVINPGLYPIGSFANVSNIITYAGGYSELANQEKVEVRNIDARLLETKTISPGGSIYIPINYYNQKSIFLIGSVYNEREIKFMDGMMISDLIYSYDDFLENAYMHFALISSKSNENSENLYYAFSPQMVLQKKYDHKIFRSLGSVFIDN